MATKNISYQIYIELQEIEPKIWRRIELNPNIFLDDFHRIVQTAMGWTNSHLHEFVAGRRRFAPAEFEVERAVDSRRFKLTDILNLERPMITYEYDFGDGWMHTIKLEKINLLDKKLSNPVCISGARCCPPEDVGGISGYQQMLEVLKDPDNDEYESYKEWLGYIYDPEYLNPEDITKSLSKKDYGCKWIR